MAHCQDSCGTFPAANPSATNGPKPSGETDRRVERPIFQAGRGHIGGHQLTARGRVWDLPFAGDSCSKPNNSPEPLRRVRKRDTFLPRGSELVHCFVQGP